MKKKILITGGTGFIGSYIKSALNDLGFEILTIGRGEKEDFKIDLKEPGLKKILEDFLPDIVCHFASGSNIKRANESKQKEFNDTVLAAENLIKNLESLKKIPASFIYLSSQAVYGLPKALPVLEIHPVLPINIYGECKLKVESIIAKSKINYLVFRVSSVYGEGQNYKKSGVIANFINKMKNNQNPIVFNSVNVFSDFIYVKDVVNLIINVIKNDLSQNVKNEIFNLGSGNPRTLKEVLDILYNYFPSAPSMQLQENPLYIDSEHKGLYLDINKIKTKLKWTPQYSLEAGLKEMLENIKLYQKA